MGRQSKRNTTRESTLCKLCTRLFSQEGLDCLNSSGFRHWTRAECTASGNDGCRMCQFIITAAGQEYEETWADNDRLVFRNFINANVTKATASEGSMCGMHELQGYLESVPDQCIIKICPFAKEDDPMGKIVHRRSLCRDVKSRKVFAAANSIIKECRDPRHPHKLCQYSRNTILPKRVLDVGRHQDQTVRLQINEIETHAPYLALSYCWGKQPQTTGPEQQPLRLRTNTLEDMEAIALERLQPSIRDAVIVTRRLQFRYLWVDALCIVQDSESDKREQLSQMAAIYKNAAITIAAATARSAKDGFLSRKRCRPFCPDFALAVPMPDGEMGTVHLLTEAYKPRHPLDERGWALQEFMLSSRLLIFSDYELLWQCKEVTLRGVTGGGLDYLQPLEELPWTVFDQDVAEPSYGALETDKLYLWRTITQQYTERTLTDPEDRLPAIQGITSELETLWHDRNLYGLWTRSFVQLLAWYKPPAYRASTKRRHLQRAPSWSWASLDGPIAYAGILCAEEAKVQCLTVSTVQLTCRILRDEDIMLQEQRVTIREKPDLADPITEFGQVRDKETEYLLLGSVQEADGVQGVGLLVVDMGVGMYRRLGLAFFADMTLWDHVVPQTITFEPKLEPKQGLTQS